MTWGSWGKNLSKKDMQDRIAHCLDIGIHSFDHADIYGAYTTEKAFGKALSPMGLERDSFKLISKCGIQYVTEHRENRVKHYNYSKEYIIWSVEQSLRHLQTDYLDLLLLHRPSPLMVAEEIAEAISILKQQGKIRCFGVSNFNSAQMDLIGFRTDLSYNQVEFSLTEFSAMHNGTFDHMMSNGIGAMAWSPLGSLFKENNARNERIRTEMEGLMEKYEASLDQLLLAWIMKHPVGINPVIGTTDPNRMLLARKAEEIELELEDWFELLVASQGHKVP